MTWGIAVDYLLAAFCVLTIGSLTTLVAWLVVAAVRDARQLETDRRLQFQRFILTLAAIRALLATR